MLRRRLLTRCVLLAAALVAMFAGTAHAGEQKLKFRFGPIIVTPGQNDIIFEPNKHKPKVPGWITSFKPNLVYKDGTPTRTDVIHLHHGVWLKNGRPQFAAGEEKSIVDMPDGFGWRSEPTDSLVMNHMVHNLTPNAAEVYLTWEVDFIPEGDPAAAGIRTVETQWLDVVGIRAWPVFDAERGQGGKDKRFTFPDEAPGYKPENYPFNRWRVGRDGVLVGSVGHLHPGGLNTELKVTRDGRTVTLFRSEAKYFEPAGAVSWDVALTATPKNWRIAVKAGDVVTVHATYDTSRASWYESMGIMPVAWEPGGAGGTDPFAEKFPTRGKITHGPLKENRNHGGGPFGLPDARRLKDGASLARGDVKSSGFLSGQGDLHTVGRGLRPPTVPAGRGLTFVNRDAKKNIMHTITACKAPCNRETGIAYPLADSSTPFDSGNLGFGPAGRTAAENTDRWSTPKTLRSGTYTYFCRVHPFMRGAFRVKPKQG